MAFEVYCDYCGEGIDGWYATIDLGGRYDDAYGSVVKGPRYQLHPGEDRDDEESCLHRALTMLGDMKRWAHEGEGSGLVWRLVSAGVPTDAGGGPPVGEEWRQRIEVGTPLYKLDLCGKAEDGLRAANLVTLEEVAARSEEEIRAISGVGPKSFRQLCEELEQRGLSFREEAMH
jgi:hypothetical protein